MELSTLTGDALTARLWRFGELTLLTATHQSLFTVPLALIAITVAEINRFRTWFTYALIGLAIALAGFYLQYVSEDAVRTIVNPYAVQAFAIEGICAGFVYWALAGRYAGWRRGGALVKAKPMPLAKRTVQVSDVPPTGPVTGPATTIKADTAPDTRPRPSTAPSSAPSPTRSTTTSVPTSKSPPQPAPTAPPAPKTKP
jgi:hypothetical protein